MTFYEMTRPAPRKSSFFDVVFEKLIAGTKAVQYGRMIEALAALSDDQLAQIGVERRNIPARARACIYGEDVPVTSAAGKSGGRGALKA